ncbi:MAG: hypothetical protein WA957_12380 [Alteraurantiacibacter sp.]
MAASGYGGDSEAMTAAIFGNEIEGRSDPAQLLDIVFGSLLSIIVATGL